MHLKDLFISMHISLSSEKQITYLAHTCSNDFALNRSSKWPEATSRTSSASPASSRRTRARTSVGSSTSAAPWRSTTVSAPTCRWSQRASCRSRSGGHRETTRAPDTRQRPGNCGGVPLAASLTVIRAVRLRVGRSVCMFMTFLQRGTVIDARHHTAEAPDGSRPPAPPFVCLCCHCLDASAVEMILHYFTVHAFVFLPLWYLSLCLLFLSLKVCVNVM